MPQFKHGMFSFVSSISRSKKTSDFEAIVRTIPRYLFRVHSSKSQGSFSSSGFHAGRPLATHKKYSVETKALLSAHLLWQHTPSYWISTTSSLLWALIYARWKARSGENDVSISLIASDYMDKTTIFAATYLVNYYGLRESGKIWHDKPAGEYLVKWKIPTDVIRGTVRFQDISAALDRLTPELIDCAEDRPSQATRELRRVCFPERNSHSLDGDAGRTGTGYWPFSVEECVAARHIARSFEYEEAQWLLITMCLSFRRRNLDSMEIIIAYLKQEIMFGTIVSGSLSGRNYLLTYIAQAMRKGKSVCILTGTLTLIRIRPS